MSELDYSMVRGQVLIVDDEPEVLNSLRRALRRDFDVFTAHNAEEGFDVLRNHPIQVIISDQRMPDISGATFLANIRESYPDAIRMLITGYTDMDALVDAVNQGQIHRYIAKPWDPQELRNAVVDAYDRYRVIVRNHRLAQTLAERNEFLIDELERYRKGHAGCTAELANVNERHQVLRQLINDAMIVLDEDGLILDFNRPAERLLGRVARDTLNQSFVLALPHPTSDTIWQYIQHNDSTPLPIDLPMQAGNSLPIEIRAQSLHSGDTVEYIVVIRDLSLQRERSLADLLAEHLFDGVSSPRLLIDQSGHIRRANTPLLSLLGYDAKDLWGHPLRRIEINPPTPVTASALTQASATGRWEGNIRFRRKRGGSVPCHVALIYLNGSAAKPGFLAEIHPATSIDPTPEQPASS